MDCSLPRSSVHGILQARILERVAISFSRGSFPTQGLNLGLLHCRQILSCLSASLLLSLTGSHRPSLHIEAPGSLLSPGSHVHLLNAPAPHSGYESGRYPWSCHCPTSHSAGPVPQIHLLTCPPLYPRSTCPRSHLDSAPDSSHPLKPDSDSHHYSQTWQSSPGCQVDHAQPCLSLLPVPACSQSFPTVC